MRKAFRVLLYILFGVAVFVCVLPVTYYLMNPDSFDSGDSTNKISYYDMGWVDAHRLDIGKQIGPIIQYHGYITYYDRFGCTLSDAFIIPRGYEQYMNGLEDGLKERYSLFYLMEFWDGNINKGKSKAVNCELAMDNWSYRMEYRYNSSLFK